MLVGCTQEIAVTGQEDCCALLASKPRFYISRSCQKRGRELTSHVETINTYCSERVKELLLLYSVKPYFDTSPDTSDSESWFELVDIGA